VYDHQSVGETKLEHWTVPVATGRSTQPNLQLPTSRVWQPTQRSRIPNILPTNPRRARELAGEKCGSSCGRSLRRKMHGSASRCFLVASKHRDRIAMYPHYDTVYLPQSAITSRFCADTNLLSLHLTYLTVQMAILPEDDRIHPMWWLDMILNGTLNQTVNLLDAYSHAGMINVGQIIFDYSCEGVGPSLRPEPRSYLAFQRPEGRRHTLDRTLRGWQYPWLGFDRSRILTESYIKPYGYMVARLSREIASTRRCTTLMNI
jgi:hypothetical protein